MDGNVVLAGVVLFALFLGYAAIKGALGLLADASNQGFLGLAAYIALWVFLFPVMAVVSILAGILLMFTDGD